MRRVRVGAHRDRAGSSNRAGLPDRSESPQPPDPESPDWAGDVSAMVRAAPAGPAGNRLVCVDGFSGSGKSTLAAVLAARLGAPLLAIEDLYPGWEGLGAAPDLARRGIGEPLAAGRTLHLPTWDWRTSRPGPVRSVEPAPVVVLEGCGSGARALAPTTSLLVWVDAPADERDHRLRARADWLLYAPFRETWRRQENALAARDHTPDRADVVLET